MSHTYTESPPILSFFPLSPTRVYFSVAATSGHFSNVSLTLLWFLLATSAGEGGHGMRGEEREGPVWCALSNTCTEGLRFSLSKRRTQGVAFFFFFLPLSVVRDFPVLRRPDTQSTVRWKGLLWTKGAKKSQYREPLGSPCSLSPSLSLGLSVLEGMRVGYAYSQVLVWQLCKLCWMAAALLPPFTSLIK